MSNPTYGQGSDPMASGDSSAGAVPEPYASDQPVSSEAYTDVPSQPADVSYGTVEPSDEMGGSRLSSTKDTAIGEAGAVRDTAMGASRSVAATARDQAVTVKDEATFQAKSLLSTVSDEVRSQGRTQQSRLAEAVHSISKELGTMASRSDEGGPLTDLAHRASRKGGEVASWLENQEPADVLEDVRSFARRRPATFLGLCALAGIVVGRLGRSAVAASTSLDSKDEGPQYGDTETPYSSTSATYATTVPDTGYATGYDTGYDAGYSTTSGLGDEGLGRSMGSYAAGGMPESGTTYPDSMPDSGATYPGTMPETGATYPDEEGLRPPYGEQDDVNR